MDYLARMEIPDPIAWGADDTIRILDQTELPGQETYRTLETVADVVEAIRTLRVRGAPLIGVAAAMGMVVALRSVGGGEGYAVLAEAGHLLKASRPTAVNLAWAVDRMLEVSRRASAGESLRDVVRREADRILEEERESCDRIGEAGLPLLPDGATVMTICNAGVLATGGIGTATAPIYRAHALGRRLTVLVPETRPLLQGARLTAWELTRAGVAVVLLPDGAIASRLKQGDVTGIFTGADRIARNGDVANKVGTLGLALAARHAGVRLYVAAPESTFDPRCADGTAIPIEMRGPEEVRALGGVATSLPGIPVWNPAFDVTPAELIDGYLTPSGLLRRSDLERMFDAKGAAT